MLKVSILLLRIYAVITFCNSVICIYNRHILYFSLLANYYVKCDLNEIPMKIFHSNLNSISSHNFSKVSLFNTYTSLHSFEIICLSETYLDSSILSHEPNLEVQEYDLIRADHSSIVKRGGVCIYNKNRQPLKLIYIIFLH